MLPKPVQVEILTVDPSPLFPGAVLRHCFLMSMIVPPPAFPVFPANLSCHGDTASFRTPSPRTCFFCFVLFLNPSARVFQGAEANKRGPDLQAQLVSLPTLPSRGLPIRAAALPNDSWFFSPMATLDSRSFFSDTMLISHHPDEFNGTSPFEFDAPESCTSPG